MDKFISMKVFREIIETGSFVSASEKLDLSKAMTSNYLKALEEELGVRLINRTSRKISLTEEGKSYYEHCKDILDNLEEVESSLKSSQASPKGLLRVAIPNWFHFSYFNLGIAKYLEKYPEVILDLSLNDRVVDLVEEGIDIALRVTKEPHSTLIARRICEVKFFIVGSKKYFEKYDKPKRPIDLEKHKFISQNNTKIKKLAIKDGEEILNININNIHSTNSTTMCAQMATTGIGITGLPEFMINEEPYKSNLEIILEEYPLEFKVYLFAVYSNRRYLLPKVRTFIDFMVNWFKNQN